MDPTRKKYERPYTLVFLSVFLALFLGQLICYKTLHSLLYVLDNSMYVIATLVATIFLLKARQDEGIFEQFYRNVVSYEFAGDEFFNETDTRLRKLAGVLGPIIALSCIGIIVYPIMNASFTNVDLGSPSTLIYLSSYPWKIDSVPKYAATIVLQLCSGSVVCSVVVCMIFFLLYCIVVLEAHCNILTRKIRRINEQVLFVDSDSAADFRRNWNYDDRVYRKIRSEVDDRVVDELRDVIKYHQFLNRFTYDVIACCTRIVDTSTAAVFSCIIILITIFLMNSDILLQLYNVKWYRRSLKFKKLLLTVMTRCQLTFQLRAFNTLDVNYLFFTMLLKNIYSVLQFIIRMQKEKNV
ncbi:uncharacterized protein LOC135846815 [Planococcus citri]|uniref:uncharacterized protein LOC135846815 n=1 Tax=Planococcus citri TaxID=170843 RepID=UPI0031F8A3B3